MILRTYQTSDRAAVKKIYIEAFPKEERPPFGLLWRKLRRGKSELLIAEDNGEPIGFAYSVCLRDLVYLFFLAVRSDRRGQGVGSFILRSAQEQYAGRRLFLARETLDETAPNYGERVRRREFYLKNGLADHPAKVKEGPIVFDVMGIGGAVHPAEYRELMTRWAGPIRVRMFDPKMIE